MKFTPISIDAYIIKHLRANPKEDKVTIRRKLISALLDFKRGVKCSCGSNIWVIGSASVGNACFRCITGEKKPNDDYEIAEALVFIK